MSVRVRPATVADAPWLAEVSRTSFAPRLHDYLISAQHGISRFWDVVMAHPASYPDRCFLVAEDEGTRLGFADLTLVGPDRAHLSYVCVVEEARGRGVARSLLRAYVEANPQVGGMQLDVFTDNAPARRLYDALGFEVDSTSTWWVADLALDGIAPTPGVRLKDLHTMRAWLDTYGFAELAVTDGDATVRLGRPSARVLRCFDPATLQQPALVAALVGQLPQIDRALVITPGDDAPPSAVGALSAANRTLRMSAPEIRSRLESR